MHVQNTSRLAHRVTASLLWALLAACLLLPATAGASPDATTVPLPAGVEEPTTTNAVEQAAIEPEIQTPEASGTAAEATIDTLPWNALEGLTGSSEGVKPEQMSSGCGGLFGCVYKCCEAYNSCLNQCGSVPSGWGCGPQNQCQGDPCGC